MEKALNQLGDKLAAALKDPTTSQAMLDTIKSEIKVKKAGAGKGGGLETRKSEIRVEHPKE